MFPGRGYKFLHEFEAQKTAFLDLPGLELPEGPVIKAPNMIARIAASQKTQNNLRDPDVFYKIARWQNHRGAKAGKARGRIRQAVVNFFDIAAKGDLIVVPSTLQLGQIKIGEFTAGPDVRRPAYHPNRYDDVPIPSRSVRWLASIEEHKLSPALTKTLRQQHPFAVLEKTLYPEVYSVVYRSFVLGDKHSSVITNSKEDYLDQDAALIGVVSS